MSVRRGAREQSLFEGENSCLASKIYFVIGQVQERACVVVVTWTLVSRRVVKKKQGKKD